MFQVIAYVLSIVAVNIAFSVIPLISLPTGDPWSPVSLIVGFCFVARDFAQREIGHKVIFAMILGLILSWFMASPALALASAAAFACSETADWCIYSYTKRPFSERIILSSLISTPIDSIVFFAMLDMLSLPSVLAMSLGKMLGALFVAYLARKREQKDLAFAKN